MRKTHGSLGHDRHSPHRQNQVWAAWGSWELWVDLVRDALTYGWSDICPRRGSLESQRALDLSACSCGEHDHAEDVSLHRNLDLRFENPSSTYLEYHLAPLGVRSVRIFERNTWHLFAFAVTLLDARNYPETIQSRTSKICECDAAKLHVAPKDQTPNPRVSKRQVATDDSFYRRSPRHVYMIYSHHFRYLRIGSQMTGNIQTKSLDEIESNLEAPDHL